MIAALWGIAALGGPSYAPPDSTFGPERVPFVAQEPLLCGGAAAAMLLRFWGERGVHGDDFRHLVQEERGGIATTDLVTELRHRGLAARTLSGSPDAVFRALGDGLPSILLLEGSSTLHYVVLVRADGDGVWVHDPNFGPERRLSRAELGERWSASGRWALVAAPPGQGSVAAPRGQEQDSVPRSPTVDSAMAALRAGDHRGAREAALSLLGDPSRSAVGRRILATSFYLSGEEEPALRHWNALSEPRIDLVEIRGAQETRHHVLAHRLGLSPGTVLTARDLRIGRRRLSASTPSAVPAWSTSRWPTATSRSAPSCRSERAGRDSAPGCSVSPQRSWTAGHPSRSARSWPPVTAGVPPVVGRMPRPSLLGRSRQPPIGFPASSRWHSSGAASGSAVRAETPRPRSGCAARWRCANG